MARLAKRLIEVLFGVHASIIAHAFSEGKRKHPYPSPLPGWERGSEVDSELALRQAQSERDCDLGRL